MMKKLAVFIGLSIVFSSSMAQDKIEYKKVVYPEGYSAQIDVVYTKVGDWDGRLDIYTVVKEKGPSPVIINIHGGGWNHREKESQTSFNTFF